VVALGREDTRSRVLVAWAFVLLGLVPTALLAGVQVDVASSGTSERVWLGVPLLLVQAAAVTAAALAGAGIREALGSQTFSWRQPVGAVVAVAALVTPLLGLGWWAVKGTDGVLDRRSVTAVPAYMTDAAKTDPRAGVLVVRGSQAAGFRYLLLHDRGLRLGDESVLPTSDEQKPLTALVANLASAPGDDVVTRLLGSGVRYVYAPRPVDQQLAGNLDSLGGVDQASALVAGSRAWKLPVPPGGQAPEPDHGGAWQPWLVALECLGVLVAGVFAAPTRKRVER
jgi:hypothetical protein